MCGSNTQKHTLSSRYEKGELVELLVKEMGGYLGTEPIDNATRLKLEKKEIERERSQQMTEQEERRAKTKLEEKQMVIEEKLMELEQEKMP